MTTALAPSRPPSTKIPKPATKAGKAAKPTRPALRLLPSVTVRSNAAKTPFVLLVLGLLLGGLMGLLALNTVIDQDAFHLAVLQKGQSALDVQEAQLHEQANSDADPAALAAKAAALGMVPAGPPKFVREAKLPKGGTRIGNLLVTGTPTTPAPTPSAAAAAAAAPVTAASAAPSAAASAAPSVQASSAPVTHVTTSQATTAPGRVTTTKTTTTRTSAGVTTTTTTTTTTTSATTAARHATATPTTGRP